MGWTQPEDIDAPLPSTGLPGLQATQTPITANVYVGVDPERPYRRNESWVPLTVELTNHKQAYKGLLVVRMKDGAVEYSVPINLPEKAKKSYDLTVFFPQMVDELEFYIRSGRKETQIELVSVPTTYSETDRFVAVISAERDSHVQFAHRPEDTETELYRRILYTTPDFLPRHVIGYQNLDVLIWDGGPTTAMIPEQNAALESWIQMGGTLVLAAGEFWPQLNGSPFRLYSPITLTGSRTLETDTQLIDPSESEQPVLRAGIVIATGKLLDDPHLRIWLKAGDDPFLIERPWGAGRIFFVAASIAKPLFADPVHQTIFKDYLASSYLPLSARVVGNIDNSIYSFLLSMIQAELPGTWFIAIYLGIYILLVVPVNYVVFRLLGRLEWAWFTVPIWAILFAYGAYYIGALRQQGQVSVNQLCVIEARASANTAQSTTFSSIYSPVRNQYTLAFKHPVAFPLPISSPSGRPGEKASENPLFVQYSNEGSQVYDFNIYHWSQETLKTQHEVSLGKGVAVDLQWMGGRITGSITNLTGITLYNPILYLKNHMLTLQDLKEDESVNLDRDIDVFQNFITTDWNRNYRPNQRGLDDFIQNELQNIYASEFFTQYPSLGVALLTARLDRPQLSFTINDNPIDLQQGSLRGESLLCVLFPFKETIQGRLLVQNNSWSFSNPSFTPGGSSQPMPVNLPVQGRGMYGGMGSYGGLPGNLGNRVTQFHASRDSLVQWDFNCDLLLAGGKIESFNLEVDYVRLGFMPPASPGVEPNPDELVTGKPAGVEYELQLLDIHERAYRPLSSILDESGNIKNPGRYLDKSQGILSARIKSPQYRDMNLAMEAFAIRLMINFGTEAGGKFLGSFVDAVAQDRNSASVSNNEPAPVESGF